MRRHCPAAQIIAIGKAAGQNDQIGLRQGRVTMPNQERLVAGGASQGGADIALAVRARKNDDHGPHETQTLEAEPGVTYSAATSGSRSANRRGSLESWGRF